ncbi:discoidin domain-containing protein [Lysinibacillus sp. NPDC093197]|uniref:discoidin domain-containing protein n=1 Tax=Lysinibacillus sp. NPDC093197 TaxID=3364132 RepID=UPI00381B6254
MAGTSRPLESQLNNKDEVGYKIHGYVLYDPAENLFNGGFTNIAVAPFAGTVSRTGTAFAYWYEANHYLDIEFYDDVRIWDCGYSSSSYWGALDVFDNKNGVLGGKVGILSAYSGTFDSGNPNWVMIGTLKKGRYKITRGTSLRISHEWYLELNTKNKTILKANSKLYSLSTVETWYETKMTSNTAPSPLVASSSTFYNSTYFPFKAFNGTNVSGNYDQWLTQSGVLFGWIQLDFGVITRINRLKLGASSDYLTANPKNFKILYSNDGINFKVAKSIENQTNWKANEYREFSFNAINARYIRIDVSENNGGTSYLAIGEIVFGLKTNDITEFSELSVNNFIKHGVTTSSSINQPIFCKNYSFQANTRKNENNLVVKSTNRKPLSISLKNI